MIYKAMHVIRIMVMKLKKRTIICIQIIVLIFIGLFIYFFNFMTPLCNDDYSYSFTLFFPLVKVESIEQILRGLMNHYMMQGGRMVAHFITQTMLVFGDSFFNIINSIMYLLLIIGILLNSGVQFIGTIKGIIYLILVHILLFIYSPTFSESFLWLDGSANYLWTNVILLWLFLPYYNLLKHNECIYNKFFWPIGYCFFLIGGMTNENTALAQIIMTVIILVLVNKKGGGEKFPIRYLYSAVLMMMGYIFMIAAPGNYNRAGNSQTCGILQNIIIRFAKCTYWVVNSAATLMIGILLLFMIYKITDGHASIKNIIYNNPEWVIWMTGIIISVYSMVASPVQPARAFTYPVLLMIVWLINLIDKIYLYADKVLVSMGLIILLLYTFTVTYVAVIDIKNTYAENEKIIHKIITDRENGIMDIAIEKPPIPMTKYSMKIDISEDADYYFNRYYALYYGVDSIYTKK